MSGMSWPGDLGLFKDVADKFFSDADESGLKTAAENHKTNFGVLQSALEDADKRYGDLEDQADQAGEKDRDAARDARHQYGGTDDEGSVAINSLNLVEMKFA